MKGDEPMSSFNDAMRIPAILEFFNKLKEPVRVLHWTDSVDTNEDRAEDLGEGAVRLVGASFGQVGVKATYNDEEDGPEVHSLTGKVGIVGWSWREVITWDRNTADGIKPVDVDKDDIYLSAHLTGEKRRVLIDFIFTHEGAYHRFRFLKEQTL